PTFNFGTEDFLGASKRGHPSSSRDNTGGFFFKYEHNLQRIQKAPFNSFLTFTSNFQYSTHTLPSSEQFQLGGASSVRGYPEGDYLADIGGSVSLEWTFFPYFIPKNWKLKNHNTSLREEIQPLFFIDFGAGKIINTESNERRTKSLLGIGGGLRLRIIKNSYMRLDWAKSLLDEPTSGAGPSNFYFSFQWEL
ncbi:MAG: BamA/TamA family outer membrane protein, partial [Candidatus Omnitrophica bacterium]|nr:BamA/TamA family outer membrane protein [Candidatus Omnitrophota bacterium]